MSTQTNAEKIELAEKEVKSAEIMLESARQDLAKWINLLDMRREYLGNISASKHKPQTPTNEEGK